MRIAGNAEGSGAFKSSGLAKPGQMRLYGASNLILKLDFRRTAAIIKVACRKHPEKENGIRRPPGSAFFFGQSTG